jgi:hypothetical protein
MNIFALHKAIASYVFIFLASITLMYANLSIGSFNLSRFLSAYLGRLTLPSSDFSRVSTGQEVCSTACRSLSGYLIGISRTSPLGTNVLHFF